MTAERDADALLLAQSDIVGLADIVERKQLHHQMMHAVAAGLDQREAVMPRVDVKEVGAKRLLHVVGKPEAEQVDVEQHHRVDVFDRQHGVAKAEPGGAGGGGRGGGGGGRAGRVRGGGRWWRGGDGRRAYRRGCGAVARVAVFSDLGLNLSIFCWFERQKMWPKPTTPGRRPRRSSLD